MIRLLVVTLLLSPLPAAADLFVISQPDAAYTSLTTLLPITDPLQSAITSVSDGGLTISFYASGSPVLLLVDSTPDSWASWGSPPNTEDALPIVVAPLDGPDVTSILFQFSQPLTTFGMELEPDDLAAHEIEVEFLSGGASQGTLTLLVQGNAGARLFAAGGGAFDSVQVSSETDFAAAEFRYAVATPEPGSLWLLAGVLVAFGWRRQRQSKSKSQTYKENA